MRCTWEEEGAQAAGNTAMQAEVIGAVRLKGRKDGEGKVWMGLEGICNMCVCGGGVGVGGIYVVQREQ